MTAPIDNNCDTKALCEDGATIVITVTSTKDNADGLESGAHLNSGIDPIYVNNKKIECGDLGIAQRNMLSTDFSIHEGHLIVAAEDAENYHINELGHLIYTCK